MRYRFNIARDAEPGFDSTNPGSLAILNPGASTTNPGSLAMLNPGSIRLHSSLCTSSNGVKSIDCIPACVPARMESNQLTAFQLVCQLAWSQIN